MTGYYVVIWRGLLSDHNTRLCTQVNNPDIGVKQHAQLYQSVSITNLSYFQLYLVFRSNQLRADNWPSSWRKIQDIAAVTCQPRRTPSHGICVFLRSYVACKEREQTEHDHKHNRSTMLNISQEISRSICKSCQMEKFCEKVLSWKTFAEWARKWQKTLMDGWQMELHMICHFVLKAAKDHRE